jgi:lactobin A/cerein 7B family class IIb bacteriocin
MQNEASRFDELTTEEMMSVDGGLATVALVVGIVAGLVTIAVGTNEIITSVIEHKAQHDALQDLGLIP